MQMTHRLLERNMEILEESLSQEGVSAMMQGTIMQ